jgi:hypothetical protein
MIMFKKLIAICCVAMAALAIGKVTAQDVGPMPSARMDASIQRHHNLTTGDNQFTTQLAAVLALHTEWAYKWVLITIVEVSPGNYQTMGVMAYSKPRDCMNMMQVKDLTIKRGTDGRLNTLGYMCMPPQAAYSDYQQ